LPGSRRCPDRHVRSGHRRVHSGRGTPGPTATTYPSATPIPKVNQT